MPRYFARKPAKSFWVEDETYSEPMNFGPPQVCDHVAADTGLLDQHGNTIWRAPVRIVVGDTEYDAFDEDHTLADIARWIARNSADAEEVARMLGEMAA